jgi:cytochrome c-type biogenesis protein CcmE
MRTVISIMIIALVVALLHIYALRQRIAYFESQCDREYARGIANASFAIQNGMVKVMAEVYHCTNEVQSLTEKESN